MCEEVILNQTNSAAVVVCVGKRTRKRTVSPRALAASERVGPTHSGEGGPCGRLRRWPELAASLAIRAVLDAAVEEPAGRGEQRWWVQNGCTKPGVHKAGYPLIYQCFLSSGN